MRKQLMATTLILVIILIPLTATPETIDVLIKGIDDSVKTNKQQDYKEAVMNAKLQAIERAGVEIASITRVVNFQLKYDMIESKAEAVLLPGFQIMDMGYQTDGTYQVVLSGKVTVGASDDPDEAIRGLTYAKSLYDRGKLNEAEQKFTELVSEYPDGKVAQESAFMIVNIKLRSENFDDASETYYWLKSNFPQSDFINKAEENIIKIIDTEIKYNQLQSHFSQSKFIRKAQQNLHEARKKRIAEEKRKELELRKKEGYPKALTSNSKYNAHPSWSPEGTKIAFLFKETLTSNNPRIYIMDSDGSNKKHIGSWSTNPIWSPDGKTIATEASFYVWKHGKRDRGIYIRNSDGSLINDWQYALKLSEWGYEPAWSPDGKKIVYIANQNIWVMNSDGTEKKKLLEDFVCEDPAWSPDGKKIVFSVYNRGVREIYVMDADGSGAKQITWDGGLEAAWSPDSKKITFRSYRNEKNSDIYTMSVDGSNIKRQTYHSACDKQPAWSPDGKKIAFASDRDGDFEIYVMDVK